MNAIALPQQAIETADATQGGATRVVTGTLTCADGGTDAKPAVLVFAGEGKPLLFLNVFECDESF